MVYHFLDTSAVLNGALTKYNTCYISPLVLTELEHIKTAVNKDETVKYQARDAVRQIIESEHIYYTIYPYLLQRKFHYFIIFLQNYSTALVPTATAR